MPIMIQPQTEAKLRERAKREGQDMDTLADRLLDDMLEWEARDRAEAVEGIKRGLEDFAHGRCRPFSEFATEQRAKFNLPTNESLPQ